MRLIIRLRLSLFYVKKIDLTPLIDPVNSTVVVVDAGAAKSLTTTTAKDDVYAFIFSQKGLMAGLGIQGSKITRINP